MRILKTGDPCPLCGQPILLTSPEDLRRLTFLAVTVGLMDLDVGDVFKLDTSPEEADHG